MKDPDVIGIDPGQKGGIAIFAAGNWFTDRMPLIGSEIDISTIVDWITNFKIARVVIEKVHAMPGQGVCAMFTFGKQYGEIIGACKAFGCSIIEPTPQQWKKKVLAGCDWKGKKTASVEYCMKRYPAINLFPGKTRKPHDGIADAVCLAEYGMKI